MKSLPLLETPVFTAHIGEIAKNLKFTNRYRYGYQNQEKSDASNPWYQFELRNYNQDLGRWFAPDPYGQFASPYIAMGNNPVSGVDPDGGWVNASAGGANWAGKRELDAQREHNSGAFSSDAVQQRYEDRVESSKRNSGSVMEFLNNLSALNAEYYGLCAFSGVNFSAKTGSEYLTQSEISSNQTAILSNSDGIKKSDVASMNKALSNSDSQSGMNVLKSYSKEKQESFRASAVPLYDVKKIMSKGGGDTGKREVIQYNSDGSEVHVVYDLNADLDANGDIHLESIAFRSAGHVNKMNSEAFLGTSFSTVGGGVMGDGSGGSTKYIPNMAEAALSKDYPVEAATVFNNASKAEEYVKMLFPNNNNPQRDVADAIRHAIWSAMNARDVGTSIAKRFGNAHEKTLWISKLDMEMDIFNNNQGYRIGTMENNTDGDIIINVYNHAINGGLKMIENDNLIKTSWP